MEATKPIGLEIADSTQYIKPRRPSKKLYVRMNIKTEKNQFMNLQCKAHFPVYVACPQSGNP